MGLLVLGHPLKQCVPLVVATLVYICVSGLELRGAVYQRFEGVEVQSPCLAVWEGVRSLSWCAAACQRMPDCKAGSYSPATRRCCSTAMFAYEDGVVYTENPSSTYFQIPMNTVQYGNWTLVFRVLQGSGQKVYTTWNVVGKYHDYWLGRTDMQLGCVTLNESKSCKTLFRSRLLDDWQTLHIRKVRVTLWKNGVQKVNLVFNGTGSTYMNWFSPQRVLQSPWIDLSPDATYYNSFSIIGIDVHARRFFINKKYLGCPGDSGWLAVVDDISSRVPCDWENYPPPGFFYSGSDSQVVWQNQSYSVQTADVFAVFVQF